MKKSSFLLVFCFMLASSFAFGDVLTLDAYLDMVIKNNSELNSIQASIDAVKGKLVEIDKVYAWSLSTGASYNDDKSKRERNTDPNKQSIETSTWNYDASVNKQFGIGTKLFFGINGSYKTTSVANHLNSVPCDESGIAIAPFVKLEQSLLKDINGIATKAGIAKEKAKANSSLHSLKYKKQKLLLDAKDTYWKLSHARTVVEFKKTSFDRKKRLLEWTEKRCKMNLAEKLDLFQSQAAVKSGELNLKLACEDENKVRRSFNLFLNVKDDSIRYDVERFEDRGNTFKVDRKLEKKGTRYDVLAAMEDVNVALYDQKAARKNRGEDLTLEGKYTLNGVDKFSREVVDQIKSVDKPSYSVGLRYALPLDFKRRRTINKGYESAKISAQLALESAVIKENNDWIQLVDDWNNAIIKLNIASDIEKIQKLRYEENKNLLKIGRTTTYMILQSADDLDNATLSVFKGMLELIEIEERAKVLYGDVEEVL